MISDATREPLRHVKNLVSLKHPLMKQQFAINKLRIFKQVLEFNDRNLRCLTKRFLSSDVLFTMLFSKF